MTSDVRDLDVYAPAASAEDPAFGRRSEDRDEIRARALSWAEFQRAQREGRTPFEAHLLSLRTYRAELAAAAVRRFGFGGRTR